MWNVGDLVEKTNGYKWPGVVVGVVQTLAGKTRIVVECTAKGVEGALHIYTPEQLVSPATSDQASSDRDAPHMR
jgi:hypothetical protein